MSPARPSRPKISSQRWRLRCDRPSRCSRSGRRRLRTFLMSHDKKRTPLQEELASTGVRAHIFFKPISPESPAARKPSMLFLNKRKTPMALSAMRVIWVRSVLLEIPIHLWRQSVADNFLSHATMIQAFSKAMAKRKHPEGSIVVMSGAGVGNAGDFSHVTSYSSSKAALVHLVEALAPELLRGSTIRINAVAPGARVQRHDRTSPQRRQRRSQTICFS